MLCVDYGDRDRWDDGDRLTVDHVERYGRSCMTVGSTTADGPPPYAFTIGMWHSHRQPELAVYGINDAEVMVNVLNEIARQGLERGRPMQPGDQFTGALAVRGVDEDDYRVTLMPVHPSWFASQFGSALHFNRDNDVEFLQAVWPDRSGHRPGDAAFDSAMTDLQPQLWLPAAEHPASVWATAEARSVVPGRYRRLLADAVSMWENRNGDAGRRLGYAVGITLDWLHRHRLDPGPASRGRRVSRVEGLRGVVGTASRLYEFGRARRPESGRHGAADLATRSLPGRVTTRIRWCMPSSRR